MKAYLLAAGYATRLHPLTLDQPKPLLEVGGRALLDHLLDRIAPLDDLSEIVVIANERFHAHFEAWLARARAAAPVPIRLLNDGSTSDDDKLGAIGDIAFAFERCPPGDEPCLIAAGDNLFDADLRAVQARFRERERHTLIVRPVQHDGGPTPYNEVTLDDEGRVLRFREKPQDARGGWSAIAVYFLLPEVDALLRSYLAEGGNPDAPGHFIAWASARAPFEAVPLEGRWFDIGSRETLAEARRSWGSGAR